MIVLDFEFNQAYDFGFGSPKADLRCQFEIIQIGAVKVNEKYEIIDSFESLVKPIIYKKIHPFVEKITGLTDADFRKEQGFKEVYTRFREFIGDDVILGTWGGSDVRALYRNITYHKLAEPPLIIEYCDIQNMATDKLSYSKGSTIGLQNAVEAFELEIDRPFHNALDDAWYTARVLKAINPDKPRLKIFNSTHIKDKKPTQSPATAAVKHRRSKSNHINSSNKKSRG
jgi:DNA polymerase III epsilon subunit-like protein